MTTEFAGELVWIDDETERLIKAIDIAPPSPDHEKVLDDLQASLLDSLMGPFGLSRDLLRDVDGGNVTTLNNFERGVTANAEDRARHDGYVTAGNDKFDRADYQAPLRKERKAQFKRTDPIVDAYTSNQLPKDGRAHRDHVVSAAEIERSSKGHFAQTREQRVATANQDANKVWTDSSLNQSKGDRNLPEWAERPNAKDATRTNAEVYGIDREAMEARYGEARIAVDRLQDKAVFRKNAEDVAVQGSLEAGKLALRQILGLVLRGLLRGIVADVRCLVREGLQDLEQLKDLLAARAKATIEEMKARWAEYLKEGLSAALSGLLSSLATFFINTLITTARNVVTIIRELAVALVRVLKLIVAPEPDVKRSDTARAVMQILGGAATTVIGLGAHETIKKMIEMIPLLAPFADEIATVLSGGLVGVGSIMLLLAFDHLKHEIAFRNKRLADVHRSQQVALLQMRRTHFLIEMSREAMANTRLELAHRVEDSTIAAQARGALTDVSLDNYNRELEGLERLLRQTKS